VQKSVGRAAVLEDYNQPFTVQTYSVPEPEPGALVVSIDVATVCGSDVHVWLGHLAGSMSITPPLILGHEMVGLIEAIGEGANVDSLGAKLQVGDRIVWAHTSCGHCYECTISHRPQLCANRYVGYLNDCSKPPHFTGSFAEYSYVVPGAGRIRVPDGVESTWASAGSCALRTVIKASKVAGRIDFTDTVVIQGAGPLGLFATALLSRSSPQQLIVVGGPQDRLDLAREWGATDTVSVEQFRTPGERVARVRQLTGGHGVNVAFEFAGVNGAVAEGVDMLRRDGRYVVMGTISGGEQKIDVAKITTRGLHVMGSMSGEIGDYAEAMHFLETFQGTFDWNRMIGERFGLDDVAEAMDAMRRLEQIKPVIDPRLSR
jgi:threonine dehydrogenase-like Zn-dependent dehydrogenase